MELWVKEKGVARPMYWIEHDPLSAGKNYYVGGQGGPLFPPGRRPYGPEANWGEIPKSHFTISRIHCI